MDLIESKTGVEFMRLTLRCRELDRRLASKFGLAVDEIHCLFELVADEIPCVKSLSEVLGVSSSRTSRILKNLELRGLVQRAIKTEDRRKEEVSLTAEGRSLAESILIDSVQIGTKLFGEGVPTMPRSPLS